MWSGKGMMDAHTPRIMACVRVGVGVGGWVGGFARVHSRVFVCGCVRACEGGCVKAFGCACSCVCLCACARARGRVGVRACARTPARRDSDPPDRYQQCLSD